MNPPLGQFLEWFLNTLRDDGSMKGNVVTYMCLVFNDLDLLIHFATCIKPLGMETLISQAYGIVFSQNFTHNVIIKKVNVRLLADCNYKYLK